MYDRRDFLKKTLLTGTGVVGAGLFMQSCNCKGVLSSKEMLPRGSVVLFQGDSITDGNRSRDDDWNHVLGHGYAQMIAARLWFDYPEMDYSFFNRGISGNTIEDLNNRWVEDAIALKPTILSILIGINDVYGIVKGYLKQTLYEFEQQYRQLIILTKKELSQTTIVLCEPFILPGGRVDEKSDIWQKETRARAGVISNLAKEFNLIFLPLQKSFSDACNAAPAKHWIWDGIHPMPGGHELIAREWLKVVSNNLR
ncbi:MAG: SGNH/GDSL hydrolase family protein [Marinilabiliaceae bacterium]|nr:SGNH/GDSL hydrolase family protein [Marinilabiliaceae bacterium]